MPEQVPNEEQKSAEDIDRLPESFLIEYINSRHLEISRAMTQMGFRFLEGKHVGDNVVSYIGNKNQYPEDGTTLEIKITKGENYKSPQQIAREELETQKKSENK